MPAIRLQREAVGYPAPGPRAARWAAGLGALFAVLGVVVNAGLLGPADRMLLGAAQAAVGPFLDALMVGISLLGSIEVLGLVIVALVGLPLLRGRRIQTADRVALLVIIVGSIVELLGKTLIHQPSPPGSLSRGPRIGIGLATLYSFPSGHAFRATMMYGLTALRLVQQGGHLYLAWLCVVLICLIGYSRVYLGQHWPTDVVGGLLLGGSGLACSVALLQRTRTARDLPR